jgi:hypothetical protein
MRRSSRRLPDGPPGELLRAWAPPAALRPSGPRRRRRASHPRDSTPAERRNDQRHARELQSKPLRGGDLSVAKLAKITGASHQTVYKA